MVLLPFSQQWQGRMMLKNTLWLTKAERTSINFSFRIKIVVNGKLRKFV